MTTSHRIAAALLVLLAVPAGFVPAASADTTASSTTCSTSTDTHDHTEDPDSMTDDELVDAAVGEQEAAAEDGEALESENDPRKRRDLNKSKTDHEHRYSELKTAWRNKDGKQGTERTDKQFDNLVGAQAEKCFERPTERDRRDLPRDVWT